MGERDADMRRAEPRELESRVRADHAAGGEAHALSRRPTDPEATWRQIERIIRRETPPADLLELLSVLDEAHLALLQPRVRELAQVAGGRILLEVARLVKAPSSVAIEASLAARPPAAASDLRRYLAAVTADQLSMIQGEAFVRLKASLHMPLLEAIPAVADGLEYLDRHPGFLRWFVTTTQPGVCAAIMAQMGTQAMAQTLDAEDLWSWVDHLRLGAPNQRLQLLANETKNVAAKQKLNRALGPVAGMSLEDAETYQVEHAGALATQLATKQATRDQLFEAIGEAGGVEQENNDSLLRDLHRIHATADDVLAVAGSSKLPRDLALRLLLAAPGVTAHHVTTYLIQKHAVGALADPAVLRDVRRRVGGSLRLQDLFADKPDEFHNLVFDHEGLRDWFLESASANELLWFCGADGSRSTRAVRIVAARHPDWRWVRELTSASSEPQLRSLALNCHDRRTQQYIRDVLIGDAPAVAGPVVEGALPTDPRTRSGQGGRLLDALEGPADEVMARLADLSDVERSRLGSSREVAVILGKHVGATHFGRAAYLLDLPFAHAVAGSPGRAAATVAYLATRPHVEQAVALQEPELVTRATQAVHTDLLVVFSVLRDPNQLAAALHRQPGLLRLLIEGSDPNLVMDLVSSGPALARAEAILDDDPQLAERLPRYKHMTKAGRAAIDRLHTAARGHDDARAELDDLRSGELEPTAEAASQGKALHAADGKATLTQAIDSLVQRHASPTVAMALLDSHRAQVPALLASDAAWSHVAALAKLVQLPPNLACPFLSIAALLAMPNALRWWLELADPTALLHLLRQPTGRGAVARALDAGAPGARSWLAALPQGAALTDDEGQIFDQLRPLVHDAGVMRQLFQARFGVPAPGDYDAATVGELYRTLSRLPSAHLRQQRIAAFTDRRLTDAAGLWDQHEVVIDDRIKPGGGTDNLHPTSMQSWSTRDEMQRDYGFDAGALQRQVDQANVERRLDHGVEQFRMRQAPIDVFEQVVLHEVGHSIDSILGERTPPVYDFAGWREHNDFKTWAAEMGGWEAVTSADQRQIEEAWRNAVRAQTSVAALVGPEHPALARRYAQVGVVASAIAGKAMRYTERVQHGDRVFIAQGPLESWYSLSASAAKSAPSEYSLYAPAEYFAESYVEYYRRVDGAPASNALKGGGLPSPVKTWFDSHVDKLRYDPHRFTGGGDDERGAAPKA